MQSVKLPLISLGLALVPQAASADAHQTLNQDLLDLNAAQTLALPEPPFDSPDPAIARALTVLDVNHDGIDDLAILRVAAQGNGDADAKADLSVLLGNPATVYPTYRELARSHDPQEPFLTSLGPVQVGSGAHRLASADVDLDGRDDLVIVDARARPVQWIASRPSGGSDPRAPEALEPETFEAFPPDLHLILEGRLTRALEAEPDLRSIRLGPHAGGDGVAVRPDGSVLFVPRSLGAIFTVNSTDNLPDSFLGDGICDTENNPTDEPPTPPSGLCTLRAALEQANADPGADTIRFAIGGGGPQTIGVNGALPAITAPLTLDGTTQGGFAGPPLIRLEFDGGGLVPGLQVNAPSSLIRGLSIGGFIIGDGIGITGDDVTVESCYLGTDSAGTAATANLRGFFSTGDRTRIGGLAPGAGNLISGNTTRGGVLRGDDARFEGNTVGTDASGTMALPNGLVGINVDGDDASMLGNLISGNISVGIQITGARASVAENRIGTNRAGTAALPNGFAGVYMLRATDGVIGSALDPRFNNLISGNDGEGIWLAGSTGTMVFGNYVGTDVTGQLALGNDLNGIRVGADNGAPSSGIKIGGGFVFPAGLLGNLVSANGIEGGHGILVEDGSSAEVEGNRVGISRDGSLPLGNLADGIRIQEATGSIIGKIDPTFGLPNLVSNNLGAGIAVVDVDPAMGDQNTAANEITENSLFDNGGLGIDLTLGSTAVDGVTMNDGGDSDFGPNGLQNFPLITDATNPTPGATRLVGSLESQANTPFDLRFFTSTSCDPSGFGEAEDFLGTVRVTTGAGGFAAFVFDTMIQVNVLTATATNFETKETSELSPCFEAGGGGGTGRLGNFVWLDHDDDGLQGFDEPGLEDVVVELRNSAGTMVLETTLTDAAGFYSFDGLASGTYRIRVVPPVGLSPTLVDQGPNNAIDSDLFETLLTAPFPYTAGTVDLSVDAGLTSKIFMDGFESGDTLAWGTSMP